MGLEDYRVLLKPRPSKGVFPDDGGSAARGRREPGRLYRPTADGISEALESLGFVRVPPPVEIGQARLARPSETEIRLSARQEISSAPRDDGSAREYIVEALIRGRDDAPARAILFESLSMRFAVCQPEGAAWHFLKLVKRMCDGLSLAVVQGEKTYSPEIFWAFRLRANEQIRNQQERWREMFEGDSERLAIGVQDTWSHFLKKHPHMTVDPEQTIIPRKAGTAASEGIDVEATLPPKAARPVPARREERS
jgi:hypothetical protein